MIVNVVLYTRPTRDGGIFMRLKLDWPTFSALCDRTRAAIDGRTFTRAIVDHSGTILTPAGGDNAVTLPEFRCGDKDASEAHFTACVLERAGFGTLAALRPLLMTCDELLAFRRRDGSYSIYTHTRGSPPESVKE